MPEPTLHPRPGTHRRQARRTQYRNRLTRADRRRLELRRRNIIRPDTQTRTPRSLRTRLRTSSSLRRRPITTHRPATRRRTRPRKLQGRTQEWRLRMFRGRLRATAIIRRLPIVVRPMPAETPTAAVRAAIAPLRRRTEPVAARTDLPRLLIARVEATIRCPLTPPARMRPPHRTTRRRLRPTTQAEAPVGTIPAAEAADDLHRRVVDIAEVTAGNSQLEPVS